MLIFFLIVLDQLTKYFAITAKPDFDVIGNFLRLQYIENTGTIFGLFEDANVIFLVIAIILCFLIGWYMKENVEKKTLKEKAFMLILAGGIGNIIDRIWRGFVIDFISLKWVGIFNFSDAFVVIGVVFLIFLEIKEMRLEKEVARK